MSRLQLSLAVGAYEHVRDISSGDVRADGIDLVPTHRPIEEMLYRTHNHAEWDVAELGFGGYVARLSRGEQPYLALPVFTSRLFRHSGVYVRHDSGIRRPEDLNGKTIGMPEWGMAAAVWIRGMLTDEYGFDQNSAHWVQGGLQQPGRVDRSPPAARLRLDYRSVADRSLDDMLQSGEIDVLFSAREPESFVRAGSGVRRLFEDLPAIELDYWKRTGILPIMHFVGVRRDVYERHRWIAQALLQGFEESKQRSLQRLKEVAGSYYPLPLQLYTVQKAREVGGEDFWPYGIEPNRVALEAFLRYSDEQGLTARRLEVDEMFPPEVAFSTRL